MFEKKIKEHEAQADIDQICKRNLLNRKIRSMPFSDLNPHTAQILFWAKAERSSKRKVARLATQKLKLKVSPDQIYRFVKKHNLGAWPHNRDNKKGVL